MAEDEDDDEGPLGDVWARRGKKTGGRTYLGPCCGQLRVAVATGRCGEWLEGGAGGWEVMEGDVGRMREGEKR